MQLTKSRIAAGVVGLSAIATSVVGVVSIDGASAAATEHTMKFVTANTVSHQFGQNRFAGVDANRWHGKLVGYDTVSGSYDPVEVELSLDVAVSRPGGILYASLVQDSHGDVTGKVTGGSGAYKGARGTVTGHALAQGDKTAITIKYTT